MIQHDAQESQRGRLKGKEEEEEEEEGREGNGGEMKRGNGIEEKKKKEGRYFHIIRLGDGDDSIHSVYVGINSARMHCNCGDSGVAVASLQLICEQKEREF